MILIIPNEDKLNMKVFSGYNTRLVALVSFVSALFYYQCTKSPPTPEAIIQGSGAGKVVNVNLASEELENYLRLQQLPSKEKQHTKKMKTGNKQSESSLPGVSPLSRSPALPYQLKRVDLEQKSVFSEKQAGYLPVLKPSGASFLDTLDISRHDEEKFLRARLNVFRQRATKVSRHCNIVQSEIWTTEPLRLVWDTKHTPNVVWCPNYKVGSTSWMINFLRLAHFNDNNPNLLLLPPKKRERMKLTTKYGARQSEVYKLYPDPEKRYERARIFNNSLRMIVVRHPFSRLISAYRDKMIKENPKPRENNFLELQHHIIANYRSKNSNETSQFPTFSEFIQYVINSTEKLKTRHDWIKNVVCWIPYWAKCNVCAADYNIIMKLETMKQDQKFLVTVADMKELKKLSFIEWRNPNGPSSSDVMKDYLSQITRQQAQQIYQRYQLDYDLFGYKLDGELLDYTQN